jgi:hypothetical protein
MNISNGYQFGEGAYNDLIIHTADKKGRKQLNLKLFYEAGSIALMYVF